jgi:hypothetical protein
VESPSCEKTSHGEQSHGKALPWKTNLLENKSSGKQILWKVHTERSVARERICSSRHGNFEEMADMMSSFGRENRGAIAEQEDFEGPQRMFDKLMKVRSEGPHEGPQ